MAQTGHILVVEDNPQVAAMLAAILGQAGYAVVTAANGAAALDLLDQPVGPAGPLRLVLLDVLMPGITGIGVLRQLRARHPTIPVIAVSGSPTALEAAQAAGAEAGLLKPFSLDELRAAVARHWPPDPGA